VKIRFRQFWLGLACVGIASVGRAVCIPQPEINLNYVKTGLVMVRRKDYGYVGNRVLELADLIITDIRTLGFKIVF
jgi:hypothetical protein